jgi:hypothetical protein
LFLLLDTFEAKLQKGEEPFEGVVQVAVKQPASLTVYEKAVSSVQTP